MSKKSVEKKQNKNQEDSGNIDVNEPRAEKFSLIKAGQTKTIPKASLREFMDFLNSQSQETGPFSKKELIREVAKRVEDSGLSNKKERLGLFKDGLMDNPDDSLDFLNYIEKSGGLPDLVSKTNNIVSSGEFTFCLHPKMPFMIIASTEVDADHEDMQTEAGIPKTRQGNYSKGVVSDDLGGMNKIGKFPGLTPNQVIDISKNILYEHGLNPETTWHIADDLTKIESGSVKRGKTPQGQSIPVWTDTDITDVRRSLKVINDDLRRSSQPNSGYSNRDLDHMWDAKEKLEKQLKNASSKTDISKNIVFEKDDDGQGWAYASYQVPYPGFHHDRAYRKLVSSIRSFEVYNSNANNFVGATLATLADGDEGKTTGIKQGDNHTKKGQFYVRVKVSNKDFEGKNAPNELANIAKIIENSGTWAKTD